jgi:hypothetical protein
MAVKPAGGLMSQAEYARYRKVHRSYINRLAKRGILVLRGKLVDVATSDAVLDDRLVDVAPAPAVNAGQQRASAEAIGAAPPTTFAQARTAEMIFRARLRKLDYETRSAKLIPDDEVKVQWFKAARQVRDKLLAVPAKLAPQLAALSEVRAVRELLERPRRVLPTAGWPRVACPIRQVHRAGERCPETRNPGGTPPHPAHQLRDARDDAVAPSGIGVRRPSDRRPPIPRSGRAAHVAWPSGRRCGNARPPTEATLRESGSAAHRYQCYDDLQPSGSTATATPSCGSVCQHALRRGGAAGAQYRRVSGADLPSTLPADT